MKQISVKDLSAWLSQADAPVVLDVREPWEVALAKVPGSVVIPMHEIPARVGELPAQRPIVCLCHHGMRSMQVAIFLERNGFDAVHNLVGGIDAWSREIDPSVPTY
ncbi:MAG TPA: rhodanese-like domain-containing protein [Burkholderiaceae bacterium]|jgi:rhodanese-related sulfurtransferase|nr:rhodanese-like domain-containing protein [Burkholderiaceae bacterium]